MHDDELLLRSLTNKRAAFEHDVDLTARRAEDKPFGPVVFTLQKLHRRVAARRHVMLRKRLDRSLGLLPRRSVVLADVRDADLER